MIGGATLLGDFTQTDPTPLGGGAYEQSYAYARNNPTVYVDPSGRRAVDLAGDRGSMEKNLLLYGLKASDLVGLNNGQLLRLYFDKVAFSKTPTWSSAGWSTNELIVNYNANIDVLNKRVEQRACEANVAYNAACVLGKSAPIKLAQKANIDVGVCPVFGCLSVGLHGGLPNAQGGVGLAISTPSLTLTAHDTSEKSGCSQTQSAFVYGQFLAGYASGVWSRDRISDSEYSKWRGGITGGAMLPSASFDPNVGKSGMGFGAGFVHTWGVLRDELFMFAWSGLEGTCERYGGG
jgi:hypothetical protein